MPFSYLGQFLNLDFLDQPLQILRNQFDLGLGILILIVQRSRVVWNNRFDLKMSLMSPVLLIFYRNNGFKRNIAPFELYFYRKHGLERIFCTHLALFSAKNCFSEFRTWNGVPLVHRVCPLSLYAIRQLLDLLLDLQGHSVDFNDLNNVSSFSVLLDGAKMISISRIYETKPTFWRRIKSSHFRIFLFFTLWDPCSFSKQTLHASASQVMQNIL